jgi:hypothetical protein
MLHNEELHNLYASPNIIRVIRTWKVGWLGHEALMGGMRNAYKISSKDLKGRDNSEDLNGDGRVIPD